jgi:hypothetical protein
MSSGVVFFATPADLGVIAGTGPDEVLVISIG